MSKEALMALNKIDLRVVAYREGDAWVAQCLEHDIAAQAGDFDTLMARLEATIDAEVAHSGVKDGNPLAALAPAPDYFHVIWDQKKSLVSPFGDIQLAIAA
jgi:hypothetical protein